jgi:NADH-quinone oxidoreductase subunit E
MKHDQSAGTVPLAAETDTAGRNGAIAEVFQRYPSSREYLIPILQDIQDREGYLSRESICRVAEHLGLPESKVFGVATFYNQFRLSAPGRFQIQVCRGTACHVKGSFDLLEAIKSELGIGEGQTTRDGLFSLEIVACLGACSIAPVVTINGEFFGRLDKKKVMALVDEFRKRGPGGA